MRPARLDEAVGSAAPAGIDTSRNWRARPPGRIVASLAATDAIRDAQNPVKYRSDRRLNPSSPGARLLPDPVSALASERGLPPVDIAFMRAFLRELCYAKPNLRTLYATALSRLRRHCCAAILDQPTDAA